MHAIKFYNVSFNLRRLVEYQTIFEGGLLKNVYLHREIEQEMDFTRPLEEIMGEGYA